MAAFAEAPSWVSQLNSYIISPYSCIEHAVADCLSRTRPTVLPDAMGEGRLWQDRSADGVAATRYLMGRRLGKLMQGSQLRNQEVRLVPCPACHSVNRRDFTAEINIHF